MINKAKLGQVSNDVELEKQNSATLKVDENKNNDNNKKTQETNANSNNKKPPAANGKKVVKTVKKVDDPIDPTFTGKSFHLEDFSYRQTFLRNILFAVIIIFFMSNGLGTKVYISSCLRGYQFVMKK